MSADAGSKQVNKLSSFFVFKDPWKSIFEAHFYTPYSVPLIARFMGNLLPKVTFFGGCLPRIAT
tara:strand:- start:445 stop:636 length:192 start_codon:yes stop_codon:yes gene_type:complete